MTRIPRGADVDRQLRSLGWSRRRVRRRSNKRQPEAWTMRKWWTPRGEVVPRDLIVRIARVHKAGESVYRAHVARLRVDPRAGVHDEATYAMWWQPLRDLDMGCPLALAMVLQLEGDGDPVHAAYREAVPFKSEEDDWVPAHVTPRRARPHALATGRAIHSAAQHDWLRQQQSVSRLHREFQTVPVHTVVTDELDYTTMEQRLAAAMYAGLPPWAGGLLRTPANKQQ